MNYSSRRFDIIQAIDYVNSDSPYLFDKIYSKGDAEEIIDCFQEGKSLELNLKDELTGEELLWVVSSLNNKKSTKQRMEREFYQKCRLGLMAYLFIK